MPRHWLLKSEPTAFSIDDLARAPRQTTCWDGIRNSEARNFLRDAFAVGDLAFYYHSNAAPSAVVGIVEVVRAAYPDPTAFERGHDHFDPKSDPAKPTWWMVDVKLREKFAQPVALETIKAEPALAGMALVTRGRLSVTPVTPAEWKRLLELAHQPTKVPRATGAQRPTTKRR
ncbi:MAG: EVE domain-containing protein [Planctomycetes bacterium]|nr:EVE domain-containing protein [Planctomycetota bacterium]